MPDADDLRACALHKQAIEGFTLPGAEKHYPPDLEIEPVHMDIAASVDLEEERCDGRVTVTVEARRSGAVELRLDAVAFENLSLRDPDGRALTSAYDGREITLQWADPFRGGEQRRVEVSYRVERPTGGLYFSRPTEAYPDQPWFAVTDNETERARHWLPCVDLPNARPLLDFHLRAASRFTILANGVLISETDNGDGTKTAHWRLDHPCPSYLTCFAIGDFIRAVDGEFEGRPVAYYATRPFTEDHLRRSFGRTREMLAWMTEKLGMKFPFPKYFQIALPGIGGAMENISLVSWDDVFVLDDTLAREWTRTLDEVNVHEMAHSYFGDAVVIRDYAHAWLKESWATYMEQCWFEDNRGKDEQLYQYYRDAQAYFREADERYKRPIVTREFKSSMELYDRHLYPGGACRLHTLRCELGDEAFWGGVREYLKGYAGKVVETDDFRRAMEGSSGRSLGRFFDQWFHTPGYPSLKVSFKYDAKRKEGTFEIEQTQVDEKAGVPAFVLSTDLAWVSDGRMHTVPARLDEARQTVVIPMADDPEQVRVDPHVRVLHKIEFNPGEDKLRCQLTDAADVIGRILAGRELAKTGTRKNVQAIASAYRQEPFWGVRAELAQALAEAATQSAVGALAELVAWEQDPMVLDPLVRAAGKFRDAQVRGAIQERLEAGLPYRAKQAAYEALGAQRDDAPFATLADAAGVEGYGGFAQAGAFRGLAATRRDEAVGLLMERVPYGATSNRSRPAAVSALAEIGRLQEKAIRERIVERLADLLRDPSLRVRNAAVAGLQTLQATEAAGALQAYRAALPTQEQVRVDRALQAVRRGEDPKVSGLEKQVDELQEKLRKLQDTVQRLEARLEARDDQKEEGSSQSANRTSV